MKSNLKFVEPLYANIEVAIFLHYQMFDWH
jgi:hypothetical protein